MKFPILSQRSESRRPYRSPRARFEVMQLEGRALLSTVPVVTTSAASAWYQGMIDVHVTGTVSDPGATLSPTLGFQVVSSTGRLVASSSAPLHVNGSTGSYDFWLGFTPSQLSTAGAQTYKIWVGSADTQGDIGLGAAQIPPAPPPPGTVVPYTAAPTPSTPPKPPGYVDYGGGVVFNTAVSNPPNQLTHPPGYVDYNNGVVFN